MHIFYDFIFCKPYTDGAMTANGAYRGLQKEKPTQLVVEKVGEEVTKVKPNDIILIEKYSGIEIDIDNEEYIIIRQKDLIAKIGENK